LQNTTSQHHIINPKAQNLR